MRILYIVSRRFDYLQDLTYAGLVRRFGKAKVLDWPRRSSFHLPLKNYPANLGYVKEMPLIYTSPAKFDPQAIVVAACKPDAVETYLKVLPDLPQGIPHLWIDGGDRTELGGDLDRLDRRDLVDRLSRARAFDVVLKRELMRSEVQEGETDRPDYEQLCPTDWPLKLPAKAIPFPLAVRSDILPQPSEILKYDVVFWASDNCADRHTAFKALAGQYDCDANGSIPRRTPREFGRKGKGYLTELSKARLAINVRGTGWDTLRMWEMLAMGATVLSQNLPLLLPEPPQDGRDIIWLQRDLSDLKEKADYYLANDELRESISIQGRRWALQHHDHLARANQLVAALEASACTLA